MNDTITIRFTDGTERVFPKGTSLLTIAAERQKKYATSIVVARVNNMLTNIQERLEVDAEVDFFDLTTGYGVKVYERSLSFVLIVAAHRLFPGKKIVIEHSLGDGVYCELLQGHPLTAADVKALENEMQEIVSEDLPIHRRTLPLSEAVREFESGGYVEKAHLLRQLERATVSIYSCDGILDYLYGPMVPRTGCLRHLELRFYAPGFILRFPKKEDPERIPEFVDRPKLAQIFLEAERWGELLGCASVSQLNEAIADGSFADTLRVAEALHEKKVAAIADLAADQRQATKLILIAGPSSSGKTTFAQRLGVQLRVHGIRPVDISLDDYFLDRDSTPRDETGNLDFESIDALDLPLFNQHLVELLAGNVVEPPRYNFKTGMREPSGRKLILGADQILIVEGIHGLNPRLTSAVPREQKLLIYVSALTQLSIDNHNRIPTTDTRLLRRIVRDNQFRSHDALQTLKLWPSVRKGEEINIFPYQEEAEVMFNSALIYEMSILRRHAEPLLEKISTEQAEYLEARRLLGFLRHFRMAPEDQVPLTSILREFIGKSSFAK